MGEPGEHNKLQTATLTKLIYSLLRFLIRKRDYLSRSIGRIWGFGLAAQVLTILSGLKN
jgi:hypothetical protein